MKEVVKLEEKYHSMSKNYFKVLKKAIRETKPKSSSSIDLLVGKEDINEIFSNCKVILKGLMLVDFSETNPNLIWSGPDFFNLIGVSKNDFWGLKENPEQLLDSMNYYQSQYKVENFNREIGYYRNLFRNHKKEINLDNLILSLKDEVEEVEKEKVGYAQLKGKNINYFVKGLRTIIGRSSSNPTHK